MVRKEVFVPLLGVCYFNNLLFYDIMLRTRLVIMIFLNSGDDQTGFFTLFY